MFRIIWDTRGYFFWLLVVSAACMALERIRPWRRNQRVLRPQFGQDFFWLIFNGQYAGLLLAMLTAHTLGWLSPALERAQGVRLIVHQPIWLQFIVLFVVKDLIEWLIHNALHRVPWLWSFHRVHHSIETLDWIGNFRFHWMEIVVYRALSYFPLIVLGADERVLLPIAVLSTLIGHLNHSNLNISWGPLRYLLNSPRMHVWHHAYTQPENHRCGVNFGINLSIWDWMFGTAYWPGAVDCPDQQPARLGFDGIEQYPQTLVDRLLFPLSLLWRRRGTRADSGFKKLDDEPGS